MRWVLQKINLGTILRASVSESRSQWENMDDITFIREAIAAAKEAAKVDEVPIGAVAVMNGKIIATAHNDRERTNDPLGHAELLLLQKIVGKKLLPSWRFDEVDIYVTCEPCLMCMGALLQARVRRLVFGCHDKKAGACGSLYDLSSDARLNHRIEVTSGVLADECAKLLSDFFSMLRK